MKNKTKIVLATRTDKNSFALCKKIIEERFSKCKTIQKIYFICDSDNNISNIGNIACKVLLHQYPTGPTAFNSVIYELNKEKKEDKSNFFHLLTYSKEVKLQYAEIDNMIKALENDKDKLIVVGYKLRDNVLSDRELRLYSNGSCQNNDEGIAYKVPWNTCALWNKKFVYGVGTKKLRFDEICEKNKNQLGELKIKVNNDLLLTDYEGMEDGLAIAELVTNNNGLKYKLIENELSWFIEGDGEDVIKQKKKMARKNIVLSTFMNIKGYSIEKLMRAAI